MGSKPLVRPPRLAPGSQIRLIAPAGPLLERDDITRAQELCQALGHEPSLAPHAAAKYGYLAGTDDQRLGDLDAALADPEVDAIWCIRGGYGITRLLDRVDYAGFARHPKPVIGFSDITALLVALYQETGVVTFHAPTARASMPAFTRRHFERVLGAPSPAGLLESPPAPENVLVPQRDRVVSLRDGIAEGPLTGGNLTLLQCLLGTRFSPALDGALLFLEDVGEEIYRVDRMLAHIRMTGLLQRVAGVIVGRFTELGRRGADGAIGLDEVFATYLQPLGVPVAYGFPIGHIDDQWTMPLGVRARLDAAAGTVEILEPAVG
ncbi:MAG: LD-carboxypeptidase [Gemmatimonadota bacterium]